MHDYFKGIYTCNEVGLGKSSPEIYLRAAEHMRTEPEKTVVFEDAIYAAVTAKEAGFKVVGIEDIYERESEYMRDLVHIYLENFNDVHSIVEKIKEL